MKKHILGFGIFSFIFALFAFAFAYFYAPPIPQTVHLEQPIYLAEPQSSCQKRKKKADNLQYEVISSQYFYGENKVVSRIKLIWNGYETAPRKINVVAKLFSQSDSAKTYIEGPQLFERPFVNSDSNFITVVSELGAKERFDQKKNLYAYYTIFDETSETNNPNTFISTNPTSVVFVHNGKFIAFASGEGIAKK